MVDELGGVLLYRRVPAWRIPGTGEPGGLPSVGAHRDGQNSQHWSCYSSESLLLPSLKVIFLESVLCLPSRGTEDHHNMRRGSEARGSNFTSLRQNWPFSSTGSWTPKMLLTYPNWFKNHSGLIQLINWKGLIEKEINHHESWILQILCWMEEA